MTSSSESPNLYSVSSKDREPLVAFMVSALEEAGCQVLYQSAPNRAPFRITFETPEGERMGIIAYAFFANSQLTKNRPEDEHRFQVKYGQKSADVIEHDIWQDPYGIYVTLFLGIDPERGIFVGGDPVLHSPTKFYISIEFKRAHVEQIIAKGWHSWEREHRGRDADTRPAEVLVGGTKTAFLRYIRFEREALGEDQGHRALLAEHTSPSRLIVLPTPGVHVTPSPSRLHELAEELDMKESEVLDLIYNARRLKMAVRGWAAEEHLVRTLRKIPGVEGCERLDAEGGPDVKLFFEGSRKLFVECKNVLRATTAAGLPRLDFQRTRASKSDPCSRYYSPDDFDVVAACLHAVTERWEFRFQRTSSLAPHKSCLGKLASNVCVDARWARPVEEVLREVARA
jgi:hypothetical protein